MTETSPALPEELAGIWQELRAADREATALLEGLDDAAAAWQPKAGRSWSLTQCLEHLTLSLHTYLGAMRLGVAEAQKDGMTRQGPIRMPMLQRLFVASLEPPARLKLPAPPQIIPRSTLTKQQALDGFLAAQEEARSLLESAAGTDLNRGTFPNPFLKGVRFTLGTGFTVLAAHDRRHLWQMQNIRRDARFPTPRSAA